jgi:hypothetical protein
MSLDVENAERYKLLLEGEGKWEGVWEAEAEACKVLMSEVL